MPAFELNEIDLQLIQLALREDLGLIFKDLTTQTLFDKETTAYQTEIISKHPTPIVLCGLPVAQIVLSHFKTDFELISSFQDGDLIEPGAQVAIIQGDARSLLMAERTLLNFLRHLCAIATTTRQFVDKIKTSATQVLDTRKTTPGWRHLEKYAVLCGGGTNHRMALYDAIMIKDTHIDLVGGIDAALEKLPEKTDAGVPVIMEIRNIEELKITIASGRAKIDRVLLDNMAPAELKACVALCKGIFETEASGNINLQTIQAVAKTGVDFASVGMLTHSAENVDLSMRALARQS
jgi:nicotinate-nucleotide pyrophosphorylase (carboxylating)